MQGGFTVNDLLNVFLFRPDIDLAATIRALQQKNVLEILAEPNVLTASGKDAAFLAGGQFPYPVLQSSRRRRGTSGITIQFKEFGVRLNFTPTVMADGLIHLKVAPEVSSLDFTNAVTISGFTIPALSTRRVESEMDLRDGQSFAIAGLGGQPSTDTTRENSRNRRYSNTGKAFPKHFDKQKQKRTAGDCYTANRPAFDGRPTAAGPCVSDTIFGTECTGSSKGSSDASS